MKDHQIAEIVNSLRDAAITHYASGQLRERLRSCIEPLLLAIASPVAAGSVDTEELRRLAFNATRGPWRHTRQGVVVAGPFREYTNGAAQSQIASFCVTSHEEDDEHQTEKQVPNALFSAAAYPDAVLAVIERAEKAEADLNQVNEWRAAALQESMRMADVWMDRVTRSEARVKELEAQIEAGKPKGYSEIIAKQGKELNDRKSGIK